MGGQWVWLGQTLGARTAVGGAMGDYRGLWVWLGQTLGTRWAMGWIWGLWGRLGQSLGAGTGRGGGYGSIWGAIGGSGPGWDRSWAPGQHCGDYEVDMGGLWGWLGQLQSAGMSGGRAGGAMGQAWDCRVPGGYEAGWGGPRHHDAGGAVRGQTLWGPSRGVGTAGAAPWGTHRGCGRAAWPGGCWSDPPSWCCGARRDSQTHSAPQLLCTPSALQPPHNPPQTPVTLP